MERRHVILFSILLAATGVVLNAAAGPARAGSSFSVRQTLDVVRVQGPDYAFSFDMKQGVWDAWWADGRPFVKRAFATWRLAPEGREAQTIASGGNQPRKYEVFDFIDPWGSGQAMNVAFWDQDLQVRFEYRFRFYEELPYFTVQCAMKNSSVRGIKLSAMEPFRVEAQRGGGLFVGRNPAAMWVLENGHKLFLDFYVRMVSGADPVDSNWNAAFFDPESGRAAVLGFITVESAFLQVRSSFSADDSVADDGWQGFSTARAVSSYEPDKPVYSGDSWQSEILFVMPDPESPFRALETFGSAVGARYPTNFQKKTIPTGWNAWATLLHHDLTRNNMIANATRARRDLQAFGLTTFQIDDGWQIAHGDWEPGPNFSRGMDSVASEIRGLGFTPGIWIQPFCVNENSKLAKEHPDWFAPKNKRGQELSPKDWLLLDPTNPEAAAWLHDLFHRISYDWGFKVIKIDFIYYLLLAERYYDPDATAVEAFRRGMQIIRDAVGEDAFLIEVAVPIYTGVGTADAMRLGLDITPDWGDDEGYLAQGLKPLLKNLARRYYLNHRVWISHPDMFYLGSPEEMERWNMQATLDDGRMYGTAVALSGAITKIGDQFINLTPEQEDVLRRLLPPYAAAAARPVDMFEMQYPQVWDLPVDAGGVQWHSVGAFNWGRNRRWGRMVEATDTVVAVRGPDLDLDPDAMYLAWGFWSDHFYGLFPGSGQVNVPLAQRQTDVLAIHRLTGHPQFVSTNRHISQGGTDISAIVWNPDDLTLTVTQECIGTFPYVLTAYVPPGFRLVKARANSETLTPEQAGPMLRLRHESLFSDTVTWHMAFALK